MTLEPAAANAKAAESGLRTNVANQDFSEDVPAGQVMSTDPKAGDRIRKDGDIGLTVSKGPERYRVPQLVGLQLEAAQQALSPIKLITGQINAQYSETVPAGRVIAFSPRFNTVVKPGTAVELRGQQGQTADHRAGPDRQVVQGREEDADASSGSSSGAARSTTRRSPRAT